MSHVLRPQEVVELFPRKPALGDDEVVDARAGAQGFHFDDLSYTAVPAPGAVALLAAAGMIASNRRRGA